MSESPESDATEMTPEQAQAHADKLLREDPEVHRCAMALQKAITDYDDTQQFIVNQRKNGLFVPNLEARTHTIQQNLCIALDNLSGAAEASDSNGARNVAIGIHQHGAMYFNAFFASIHYSRMVSTHTDGKPYQRLLHEGYALFERAQKRAAEGKPPLATPKR